MGKAVWDDDKCHKVWTSMVTNIPYNWPVDKPAQLKRSRILAEQFDENSSLFCDDLDSSIVFRTKLGEILKGNDRSKAKEVATWIVVDWGKIRSGAATVSKWIDMLSSFDGMSVYTFVDSMGTNRISSWSKILAFAEPQKYAVYDSRTAVALNSAMIIAKIRPHFHMPLSQSSSRNTAIKIIKQKSEDFSGGFDEYNFVLSRFVELGFVGSILEAERLIFKGADKTVEEMLSLS